MLTELTENLGSKIAQSADLIEEDQGIKAVNAALDAARRLLDADIAEVYLVKPIGMQGQRGHKFKRLACSPRERGSAEPTYNREANYSLETKGVWQYVYDKNRPIWVIGGDPDRDNEKSSTLPNLIPKAPPLEGIYNHAESQTVIAIPFKNTIEEREACWGMLNFEFQKHSIHYNPDQFNALDILATHISSIFWKTKAWEHTRKDTEKVVLGFEVFCDSLGNKAHQKARQKTGLWIQHRFSQARIRDSLSTWFGTEGIRIDHFNLQGGAHQSEIRQTIIKDHFGIVDLSQYNRMLDILIILGMFIMESKPCLVLWSRESDIEIPISRSLPHNIMNKADQIDQFPETLLHVYQYDIDNDNVVFFRDETKVDREETLKRFLMSVRTQSKTFCAAHDYVAGNEI